MTTPVTLVFNMMKCFVVKRSLVGKEQVLAGRDLTGRMARMRITDCTALTLFGELI